MSDHLSNPPPLPSEEATPPPVPPPLPKVAPPQAPATDAPPPVRGMQQVTEQTRTFPCGTCGSELEFHIGQQKLVCPHCGNVQEIAPAADQQIEEKDLRQAIAALRSTSREHQQLVSGEKEVVCQNCGGHTTFVGSLTSTRCPYCATPIQRDDVHDAPARQPVDGVLPFRVDHDQAKSALTEWINSRWFAPNEFKTYNRTGSFASVYAAYFSYDADAWTQYAGERGDDYTVTVGSGEDRRTETRTRWRRVSGEVNDTFVDLTVLANTGFDRKHVTALEPWPTDQVQPFSPEYLAGHLCRTYDHDVETCFVEGEQRMQAAIDHTIRNDIGGDKQRIHDKRTAYRSLTFTHLLLPIWLLTVIYQGQPFQVFINGVTGEVHGERPYSKVKIAIAVVLAAIVVAIGIYLYSSRSG